MKVSRQQAVEAARLAQQQGQQQRGQQQPQLQQQQQQPQQPRLLIRRDIDAKDELETAWKNAFGEVQRIVSGTGEQEINNILQAKVINNNLLFSSSHLFLFLIISRHPIVWDTRKSPLDSYMAFLFLQTKPQMYASGPCRFRKLRVLLTRYYFFFVIHFSIFDISPSW